MEIFKIHIKTNIYNEKHFNLKIKFNNTFTLKNNFLKYKMSEFIYNNYSYSIIQYFPLCFRYKYNYFLLWTICVWKDASTGLFDIFKRFNFTFLFWDNEFSKQQTIQFSNSIFHIFQFKYLLIKHIT